MVEFFVALSRCRVRPRGAVRAAQYERRDYDAMRDLLRDLHRTRPRMKDLASRGLDDGAGGGGTPKLATAVLPNPIPPLCLAASQLGRLLSQLARDDVLPPQACPPQAFTFVLTRRCP